MITFYQELLFCPGRGQEISFNAQLRTAVSRQMTVPVFLLNIQNWVCVLCSIYLDLLCMTNVRMSYISQNQREREKKEAVSTWARSLLDCLERGQTDRPQTLSSSLIQWACYKHWRVEWEAQTGMWKYSTSTFKDACGCPGHAGVQGNDRAERLADIATKTSGLHLEDPSCSGALTLPVGTEPKTSHIIHWMRVELWHYL